MPAVARFRAGGCERWLEGGRDVGGGDRGTSLSGHDVTREVVVTRVHTQTNCSRDLEVGEVGPPELVGDGGGLVLELVRGFITR